ncbi:MAG TPA: carbamoyltransferase HypF [Thermoleophilia bacterium]|nr:carbamoyltransferase HypF [Thermoleophilia bacterium]
MVARVRARVEGRVQGVGFRPAVFRHAVACGLTGFVRNDPRGVTLDVEGEEERVALFFDGLVEHAPRQADIHRVTRRRLVPKGYDSFTVVESEASGRVKVHLPPDLATCSACLAELEDPGNRRYRYPFTNCVDCGPRFTLVESLPYDRVNTTMKVFTLCGDCDQEYREPADRRFHAEPNACPKCGPHLFLLERGTDAAGDAREALVVGEAALRRAQGLLAGGGILAVKGLGGYHLACDAFNEGAVAVLRRRKERPHKSLAVMFRDLTTLEKYLPLTPAEIAELQSPAHPIVVVDGRFSLAVSPDTDSTGVFLPYTPLHHLLLEPFEALVLTSGNRRDEPIAKDESGVRTLLGPVADAALAHNRPIARRCDDSVVRVGREGRQFLRRSRGFVPSPVRIASASGPVLATGGELKNTFCLVADGEAYVSQYIGELRDYPTWVFYQEEISRWQEMSRVRPQVVAHDLHPAYLSSAYARGVEGVGLVGVQHHHAHVVSVMAEKGLNHPVLGIALDGTGYGGDGTVWGGELLVADRLDFERVAHFKTYPLPGGDKAVEEPWRMALSMCRAEGIPWPRGRQPRFETGYKAEEAVEALGRVIDSGINCPMTSSAGRLFDAVASLLGLCDVAGYEAQGAIRLEAAADPKDRGRYPFALRHDQFPWVLDFGPTLHALLRDRQLGKDLGSIAARFHETVAAATAAAAQELCRSRGLTDVVLSGGVFQNTLLLHRTCMALRAAHLNVHINSLVPPNDGGISLGQAAVAVARGANSCA